MIKKKISELSNEELKKVFSRNSKLREAIQEDMSESAYTWVDEYTECFKNVPYYGSDYKVRYRYSVDFSISGYGDHFNATNYEYFIAGLQVAQETFGLIEEKYLPIIERARQLIERMDEVKYELSDANYERLEKRIDELVDELEDAVLKRLSDEYESCYDEENQLDYFLDFYVSERMDDSFYVDMDTFILYEDVHYQKSYE